MALTSNKPLYGHLLHGFSNETPKTRPTIIIPSLLGTPFTPPLTPPTTPPLTPSSPTPIAEFSSRSILSSPCTPTLSNIHGIASERAKRAPEIVKEEVLTPLTPPLTPPSQLDDLTHSVCPALGCRTKSSGRCIGVPVFAQERQPAISGSGRKRKREERYHDSAEASATDSFQLTRAHSPRTAPCNDCLDDDESLLWGSCDNPSCWSRRDDHQENSPRSKKKGKSKRRLALICPDCSPEGGLGCEHAWICDLCAFSDPSSAPMVWECPGCSTSLCSKCPSVSPSCPCESSQSTRNPYCIDCMPPSHCRLCNDSLPLCISSPLGDPFSSLPEAESTYTSDHCTASSSCTNCSSDLCFSCRSVLKCSTEGCNAELCQLCPLPAGELGLIVGGLVCKGCEDRWNGT